jgi:hypothetical protein
MAKGGALAKPGAEAGCLLPHPDTVSSLYVRPESEKSAVGPREHRN